MDYTEKEDIYIKLMQDITGLEDINPNTRILQSKDDVANATPKEKELNDALRTSRDELCNKLGIKNTEMLVGSPTTEKKGYIEPCPIQYAGKISRKKKFHCIFLGLNPHLDKERWRLFPPDENGNPATFADLANFHHPNHIYHGYNEEKYGKKGVMKNNYWRVMGKMKHFEPNNHFNWSGYYLDILRIYLALLPGEFCEWYSKRNNLRERGKELVDYHQIALDDEDSGHSKTKKDEMISTAIRNYLFEKFKLFPILNAELIPYKSENFAVNKLTSLLENEPSTCNDIYDRYQKYFFDIFRFMDEYSNDDAYIVITSKIKEMDKICNLLMQCNNMKKLPSFEILCKFELNIAKPIPIYLLRWTSNKENYRRVVIIPSISRQSPYGKILCDIGNSKEGWLFEVKSRFGDS